MAKCFSYREIAVENHPSFNCVTVCRTPFDGRLFFLSHIFIESRQRHKEAVFFLKFKRWRQILLMNRRRRKKKEINSIFFFLMMDR